MGLSTNTHKTVKLITGIGLVVLSACSSKSPNDGVNANTAPEILVTIATPSSDGQQNINISGHIEAAQSANLSTRVMGYITKLNIIIGDHVSKGQLLGTISNEDILAKRNEAGAMISQAETGFKNAEKDRERFTNLYEQQSATAKELENANLQYSSAKAALETAKQMRTEANAMLSYTILTAPFEGFVTQKSIDAGSMATPGMQLLTIERKGSYQVSASVPENLISQVRQGAPATVSIQSINKTFTGSITQVDQSSQFTGGQYLIKVNIPDNEMGGLYGGMYAAVSIPVKQKPEVKESGDQVMVPLSCIDNKGGLTGLYTIGNNNTALLRWVRLGKVDGDKVEVLSGLAKNEQFIVGADGKLYNGVRVKIKL